MSVLPGLHVSLSPHSSHTFHSVQSIHSPVSPNTPHSLLLPFRTLHLFPTHPGRPFSVHSVRSVRKYVNTVFASEGLGVFPNFGENDKFLGVGVNGGARERYTFKSRASLGSAQIRVEGGGEEVRDTAHVRVEDQNGEPRGNLGDDLSRPIVPKLLRFLRLASLAVFVFAFLFKPEFARAHIGHHHSPSPSSSLSLSLPQAAHHHSHSLLSSSNVLTSAWAGLIAGLVHTLSGPDHLAALAPLSIGRNKFESALVGALWGCGHDVGQVLFGVFFVIFRDKLHLDLLRVWGARVVGLTLMTIGGMGIYESQHQPIMCDKEDEECLAQPGAIVFSSDKQAFSKATFVTGIVHGLQPDALLVILPALALPSKIAGASFLVMFLLGTVLAMGTYTAFIGSCSDALHKRVPWLTHRLSLVASLVAITVGVGILTSELFGFSIFG